MISAVSAYVPIPSHPRPEEEFRRLGQQLMELKHRIIVSKDDISHCWLLQYLAEEYELDTSKFSHSVGDNPDKNSLYYHIVQAQKTEWLEAALKLDPHSDVFVWIDFGIFHVPGVTVEIIDNFLDRAETECAIAIPGCWPKDSFEYDDTWPCWRFCGGVMVVPRGYVRYFNAAMKQEYINWLKKTGNISWEVNTLARLERHDPQFPVWWYAADHDASLFTNYQGVARHESLH